MANLNSRSYPKGLREIRYPSEDIIHRFTSKDYTGEIRLNNQTGLFEFNPPLEGSGGSSSGTTFIATQAGHGFTVGQPIYHDGTVFQLANASNPDTLAVWVVVAVTSPDTFTLAQSGRFEMVGHSFSPGQFYFVGETDGSLTPTEPSSYSNPVLYVETVDHVHVLPYRPSSTSQGSGGGGDVSSVFGRTGVVVAESGDYTKAQVGLGNVDDVQQVPLSTKGVALGVAELDGGGKVPLDQLPTSIQGGINIIGFWDADTNTPDIGSLTLMDGQAYQVSVAGNTNLNGITTWNVFDLAVWDNSLVGNWFKISSAGQVSSVNGYTGAVVLNSDDIAEGSTNEYYTEAKVSANNDVVNNTAKASADGSIGTHSDVDVTTVVPAAGQPLVFDGTNWTPANVSGIGDMLKSVYDPTNITADAFDYNNFYNTPGSTDLGEYEFDAGYLRNTTGGNGQALYTNNSTSLLQLSTGFDDIRIGAGVLGSAQFAAANITAPNLSIANIDAAGNDSMVSKEWVLAQGGGGAAETVISTPTAWDGTSYSIDLSTPTIYKRTVNDLVTDLTFALTFPADAATASRECIVEIDNSANTSAISLLTFTGNWKWGVGVEPSGIAAGAKVQLYLYNTSDTEVKSSWEVDA